MTDDAADLVGPTVSALDYLAQLADRSGRGAAAGRLGHTAGRVFSETTSPADALAGLSTQALIPPAIRDVLSVGPVGVAERADALINADPYGANLDRR